MTTATLDLRTETLIKALAWIEDHPGCHTEAEWALRTDVEPAPMVDYLGVAAIVCVVSGLELGWTNISLADAEESWPPLITHIASQAYDPSSARWGHVAVIARHILGLDSQEGTDLFELSDPSEVVTALLNLIEGN